MVAPSSLFGLRFCVGGGSKASSNPTRNAQHHLVASARDPLQLNVAALAQRQQPHKLALEPAAHNAQPLHMRQ